MGAAAALLWQVGGLLGTAEAAACCWQAVNLQRTGGSEPRLTCPVPMPLHPLPPLQRHLAGLLHNPYGAPAVNRPAGSCIPAGALRRGGICVAGLALLVATDRGSGGGDSGEGGEGGGSGYSGSSNPLLGDGLVLLGATLYAVCNVLQEWLLGE